MRGELSSEDTKSMVQRVHATTSDELEQQRRHNSAPGKIEKHMPELAGFNPYTGTVNFDGRGWIMTRILIRKGKLLRQNSRSTL